MLRRRRAAQVPAQGGNVPYLHIGDIGGAGPEGSREVDQVGKRCRGADGDLGALAVVDKGQTGLRQQKHPGRVEAVVVDQLHDDGPAGNDGDVLSVAVRLHRSFDGVGDYQFCAHRAPNLAMRLPVVLLTVSSISWASDARRHKACASATFGIENIDRP